MGIRRGKSGGEGEGYGAWNKQQEEGEYGAHSRQMDCNVKAGRGTQPVEQGEYEA